MTQVGFEPAIQVFETVKTFRALHRAKLWTASPATKTEKKNLKF
jgi:hypothetical protein